MAATAVYVAADTDIDRDGDEILVHSVYVGDDDAEPTGRVYTVRRGLTAALDLAGRIARDRGLELVADDASAPGWTSEADIYEAELIASGIPASEVYA